MMAEAKEAGELYHGLSIDNIIADCEQHLGLVTAGRNRKAYQSFLERQIEARRKNYADMILPENASLAEPYDVALEARRLENKPKTTYGKFSAAMIKDMEYRLVLFSYLMGHRNIKFNGKDLPIDNEERLPSLKLMPGGGGHDEPIIGRISGFYQSNSKLYNLPTYIGIINMVAADEAVVKKWQRQLTYENDIGIRAKRVVLKKGTRWSFKTGREAYR